MKILLVEDDLDLAAGIRRLLAKHGHVIDVADSLKFAKAAIVSNSYGIVLLDRMLPDGEGTDLIKFASQRKLTLRFLILSARGDVRSRVEGLDLGADDYIIKPFETDELLARIRAAERRPIPEAERIREVGNLRLNLNTHNFRVKGETLRLPRREMVVLELFMTGAGRVVTRESIESALYSYDDDVHSNTLESHISRLRKKLMANDACVTIHTIRGVGYLMEENS